MTVITVSRDFTKFDLQCGSNFKCLIFFLFLQSFSEEGTPVTVDLAGVVRLLSGSFGTSWSPVCITKSNVSVRLGMISQ